MRMIPRKILASAATLLVALPALLLAPSAEADVTTTMTANVGVRKFPGVAWTGSVAYVFGGDSGELVPNYLSDIRRYDPAADSATVMSASLPTPRYATSAVWGGSHAYVFGGNEKLANGVTQFTRSIVRYDPVTDTATTLAAQLPSSRGYTASVWTGTDAYIIGGKQSIVGCTPCALTEIVKYSPATGTVTTVAHLPEGRWSSGAVWTGTHLYILGGSDSTGSQDEIYRFHPASATVQPMSALLPHVRSHVAAAWTGTHAYLFGSGGGEIMRYNPALDVVEVMNAQEDRADMAAFWDGKHAHLVGARNDGRVLRYTPAPGAPTGLTAVNLGVAVELAWSAPPASTYYSSLDGHVIYRGFLAGGPYAQIALVPYAGLGGTPQTSFTDFSCPLLAVCYYRVAAVNAEGEGLLSNEAHS